MVPRGSSWSKCLAGSEAARNIYGPSEEAMITEGGTDFQGALEI